MSNSGCFKCISFVVNHLMAGCTHTGCNVDIKASGNVAYCVSLSINES